MTAFTASTGGDVYWDTYTGGSVNATLDSYAISNNSRLIIRTDTNACAGHSVAFGSLDTVTFTGVGGELRFDPTYVRVIAYTGGSGNSPAFGTAISQGGVSGVFLGAWTNWQSECIVPGAAIGAAGFIKIGGKTGGNFAAGALTGIAATCSGPDVQGWIEIRGPDVGTITVPRIGKVSSVEAWFDLGTTTGARGQIIPCPTTATFAGVWPGVWIETSAGSGVYERFCSVGSQVALSTTPTDERGKFFWQTTGGIRIGNDGTNAVGYLPPAGCKVRIPAIILTNCTRNASTGSGPRTLPSSTIATRQEFVTTGAGYIDLAGVVCQWYANFSQAYYARWKSSAINDSMVLSEIASALDVSDCIVSPTQAQLNTALNISSCFAGGTVKDSVFARFSLAASGAYCNTVNYVTGVSFDRIKTLTLTIRGNVTTGTWSSTQSTDCVWNNCTNIGGRLFLNACQRPAVNNLIYADSFIATTATNPNAAVEISGGSVGATVTGMSFLGTNAQPYTGLVSSGASYSTLVKEIGTFAAPLNLGSANQSGLILSSSGNNADIKVKRCFASNTRTGLYAFVNSDTNVLVENVFGDYADASGLAALNAVVKGCGLTGTTIGQISVYGTHWLDRFINSTSGRLEIVCNEPTATSASQCMITAGTPKFNSNGSVLLTVVGQQVQWEMPYFAKGHTALANAVVTLAGTSTVNLSFEFQYDIGSGYNGSWLVMSAANFVAVGAIDPAVGIRLKVRATCITASAANVLTNIMVTTVTTASAQSTNFYPLSTNTLTLSGLIPGTDVVVLTAGTPDILAQQDSNAGTLYTYTYSGAQTVDIGLINPGYVPLYIRGLSLGLSDSSIPIAQVIDRNFI